MINKLKLQNFRNFRKKSLGFSPKTTVIIGPNTIGKTNILEGIYLLSTGKSFRARVEEEMISYDSSLARVSAELRIKNQESSGENQDSRFENPDSKLEVVLTRGEIEVGENKVEKVPRKKLLVNGVSRRLVDFAGNLKVVLFGPWDMELVTDSPSTRRAFLDAVLSQVDREYRRASLSYEKGLRQRNRLLYRIREEGLSRSQLLFWDRLLIKNGNYLSQKRSELIEFCNSQNVMRDTRDEDGELSSFQLEYDDSAISEGRLEQYAAEEVAAATTLVGPHRDDFTIIANFQFPISNFPKGKGRSLALYGSRGEQRMSVLWLKLAELSFIEVKSGERPTLLLDDIFSELDHEHREVVMNLIQGKNGSQTIITTADPHFIESFKKVEIINLNE